MSKVIVYTFLSLIIFLLACSKNDEVNYLPEDHILVEGYLYAGEPVQHLKVSQLDKTGASTLIPLEDADLTITHNNIAYPLLADSGSNINYSAADFPGLEIIENETYHLEVLYKEHYYTSSCTVPPRIDSVIISSNTINIDITDPGQVMANISWTPVPGYKYCIFLRSPNSGAQPVSFNASTHIDLSQENPFTRLIEGESVDLKAGYFSHYGEWELYVTAVSPEYETYYQVSNSSHFSTAESNITDGWGIFTAFNGYPVTILVQ